jgi:hypothetical protein
MKSQAYLVQLFLPVSYNNRKPIEKAKFQTVQKQLTDKFEGLTAFTQAPAEGFWGGDKDAKREKIIIFEVMTGKQYKKWWRTYRRSLEAIFRQEKILILMLNIVIL